MANAWCINAIWFDWTYLRTLQNLDSSNIGVGVAYTAPNPLDDKRFDYIKYTDKCWCTCCLTTDNEILIYATQWVIKNLTLTNDDTNEVVNVKWTEVFWSNRAKTIVRYKTTWYPTSPTDWTLAVESTVKNQYATNWFNVSWLEDLTTYYFSVFAVDSLGTMINVQSKTVVPDFERKPTANTVSYIPMMDDLLDHWPNSLTVTNSNSVSLVANVDWATKKVWYFWWAKRYLSFPNTSNMSWAWTILCRINTDTNEQQWIFTQGTPSANRCLHCWVSETSRWMVLAFYSNDMDSWNTAMCDWNWHLIAFTYNWWWSTKIYVDAVLLKSWSLTGLSTWNNTWYIWRYAASTSSTEYEFTWYMSRHIIENKERTQAELTAYYNKTKWKFSIA